VAKDSTKVLGDVSAWLRPDCELDVNTDLTRGDVALIVAILEEHGQTDPEAAHSIEDDLYLALLTMVAQGKIVQPLAEVAVTSQQIPFSRWCA
jgi:hypothetical protein